MFLVALNIQLALSIYSQYGFSDIKAAKKKIGTTN